VELPSSAHGALRRSGMLPDFYADEQYRACEWVEHRHWIFQCSLTVPEAGGSTLVCPGLDGAGWVYLDGAEWGAFDNTHVAHEFRGELSAGRHLLRLVFDCPPRWLGQIGRTSRMPVNKPRFYYTWDWVPRLVQVGVTDPPYLLRAEEARWVPRDLTVHADAQRRTGSFYLRGELSGAAEAVVTLALPGAAEKREWRSSTAELARGRTFDAGVVELWQPRGLGAPVCYELQLAVGDAVLFRRRIGFRQVRWLPNPGAPEGAAPWLCEINGAPLFLQGVNWTPIRPLTADVPPELYEQRLASYREMGVNLFRVWGGASKERAFFYDCCDRDGFLVWQEFPLSSSGVDNLPPDDAESIRRMLEIANEYVPELASHPSLLFWSGGNELMADESRPCRTEDFALLALLRGVLAERDPERRMVPTSASGPCEWGREAQFGRGLHEDVHGPWRIDGTLEQWYAYWDRDDALFHSEIGCCSASPREILARYAAKQDWTVTEENPFWNRPMGFWNEAAAFRAEKGRLPETPEEYIDWTADRQYRALGYAARSCKRRFPRCGGFVVWMGHDCYPCAANTAVIDFEGNPKSGARALAEVFNDFPAGSDQ